MVSGGLAPAGISPEAGWKVLPGIPGGCLRAHFLPDWAHDEIYPVLTHDWERPFRPQQFPGEQRVDIFPAYYP
jgi:hypothetical protein